MTFGTSDHEFSGILIGCDIKSRSVSDKKTEEYIKTISFMTDSKIQKIAYEDIKFWYFNDKEIQEQYNLHIRKIVNQKIPSKMRTDYLDELKLLNIGRKPFQVS